jgi:hypothetical protein
MVGGELPSAEAWTLSLLTNPEVIAVDQHSTGNHPVINTGKAVVWLAQPGSGDGQRDDQNDDRYLAVFNISESGAALRYEWKDLGLAGKIYKVRDLWSRQDLDSASSLSVTLPPHGSVLYRLSPVSATHP